MTLIPDERPSSSDGLWVTMVELASRKGVTRQSIHERVKRLASAGLITIKPGRGRSSFVNLAEYDRVVGEVADLGREQGARTKKDSVVLPDAPPAGTSPTYTKEQARHMAYKADLAQMELAERKGNLVRLDLVQREIAVAGGEITRLTHGLIHYVDDIVMAVETDGLHGCRVLMKKIIGKLQTDIADAMDRHHQDSPEQDDPFTSSAQTSFSELEQLEPAPETRGRVLTY